MSGPQGAGAALCVLCRHCKASRRIIDSSTLPPPGPWSEMTWSTLLLLRQCSRLQLFVITDTNMWCLQQWKIFEGLLEILYPPDGAPGPRLHGDLSAPAGEARLLAVTLGPGHRQLQQPGARGPRPSFTSCSYKHIGKWVEKTTCLVSFHFQII